MSWRGAQFAEMQCRIVRKPFLGARETIAWTWILDTPAAIDWTSFALTFESVDPVVRAGYRYFVEVDLYRGLSYFGGLKITYRPPAP